MSRPATPPADMPAEMPAAMPAALACAMPPALAPAPALSASRDAAPARPVAARPRPAGGRWPALALALAVAALPGCSALNALKGEPARDVFELRPPPGGPRHCGRGAQVELVIEEPKSSGTLDSERIMIRPSALQTQYLPDAQWGDTVPVTLQNLLVRSFGTYDVFNHVGRAPLAGTGDYALLTEVLDFNAEVAGEGALVRLTVDAQLVREADARVVARGRFATTAPAASTRSADLIPAFDVAARQLLEQMTAWGLQGIGVNPARCRPAAGPS